jgi:hypothetical protein
MYRKAASSDSAAAMDCVDDPESHSIQEIDRLQQLGRAVVTGPSLLQWPAERHPRDVQVARARCALKPRWPIPELHF